MYLIDSFSAGRVLVVNSAFEYRSEFLAENEEAGEKLVVELNKPDLLASLATHRFNAETAGLVVGEGLRILTDRESQAQLANSYVTLKSGLIPDTDWKAANGWQVSGLAEIEPIAKTMAAHVRACFRGERAAATTINAASTMADIEAVNITTLFGSAYQEAFDEVMHAEQATE